jgi:DNA-binding response OmpR family regulator
MNTLAESAAGTAVLEPELQRIAASVLIVEDDADTRSALQISVMSAGMFVHVAEDGEDAVELARLTQPDVVLLDLGLPGLGGMRTLSALRQVARGAKVVVVSAFEEDVHADEAIARGARLYLEKPIGREQLLAAIEAVLE